ncbi:fimbrial chaperone [Escherichia coli]|nr:fimbrial chaperone [Escherichia coli]MDY8228143.1 fimbrial chaperone [Escherichia coli]HBC6070910.1 fimbrial chaperone [Escherichia coli]
MNNVFKYILIGVVSLFQAGSSFAAFTVSGTRFIYEEGKKNISFEVSSSADDTYGGQVWVDNVSQNHGVYMVPVPPFFRIAPKEKQIVRIMNLDGQLLPKDRESLFWLNIQEIPPKPKSDGNVLAVAVNTRVKLFYRPKTLSADRKGAEKRIQIVRRGNTTYLKNPTPYYFAITKIKVNGRDVVLSSDEDRKLSMFSPFEEIAVSKLPAGAKEVSVFSINDWGGVEDYTLKG